MEETAYWLELLVDGGMVAPNKLATLAKRMRRIDSDLRHQESQGSAMMPLRHLSFLLHASPFLSDWHGELLRDDKRWQYGVPPAGNEQE
ncbi:MAG: hypothetical protein ACREXX_16740 [Gammaproteobacteria bacterium]